MNQLGANIKFGRSSIQPLAQKLEDCPSPVAYSDEVTNPV
jgi:hypothetical protein